MGTSQHDLVERQFGAQADAYLASAVHAAGPDLERIAEVADALSPARAVDLGCGGGHVSYHLAPHAREVIACDLSPAMLEAVANEARRRGLDNIGTVAAAAEHLPFPDGHADMLVSRMSAHHWRDLDAGLREVRRVARAGAVVLIADTLGFSDPLVDTHLQAIELLRDPSHVRDYRADEWLAALGRAGLILTRSTVHPLPLAFGPWVERMRTPAAQRAAISALQAVAPAEVRKGLSIGEDGSFAIQVGLFELIAA